MTNQELNELVARKLGKGHIQDGWEKVCVIPNYSTSIQAAWEIVEWLGKQDVDGYGYSVNIFNMDTDPDGWYCSISHLDSHMMKGLPQEKADTAPLAICKAFLKLDEKG